VLVEQLQRDVHRAREVLVIEVVPGQDLDELGILFAPKPLELVTVDHCWHVASLVVSHGLTILYQNRSMAAAPTNRWTVAGVDFDVDTLWGLTVARGRFDRVAGSYEVSPEGTTIELTVDAGSLVTENGVLNSFLRSTEFSDLAEDPEVRFRSTRVSDSGEGKLRVGGLLEGAGKVVAVEFDAVVRRIDHGLQLEAVARVDSEQLGKGRGQLGMILPATLRVRARLTSS
jgi:polyisoprenoid-binding protein YceI